LLLDDFSCHGVNEFHHGGVRFVTLDEWVVEFRLFEKLQEIAFFNKFKKSKAFLTWRRVLKRQKFAAASASIMDNSCIFGNVKMRHCFLQVRGQRPLETDVMIFKNIAFLTQNKAKLCKKFAYNIGF
jgi:hypothetical protein